jgi:hypothetical protein
VRVSLSGTSRNGKPSISRSVVTNAGGRFSFDSLPAGKSYAYILNAQYQGGLFPGRPISLPSGTTTPPVIATSFKVWDTTNDPTVVGLAHDDLFAIAGGEGITVIESVEIVNAGGRAYIGRGAMGKRGSNGPSLGFALPAQANKRKVRIVDSDLALPNLIDTDFGFGITVAVPPGVTRITFSYPIAGTGGSFDLSRTALYPIEEFSAYAGHPLSLQTNRLTKGGDKTIGGRSYVQYSTHDEIQAGDQIQIAATAEAGTPAGLLAGISIAAALALGAGAFALLHYRRGKPAPKASTTSTPPARDELIAAIAALDVRHDNGEMTDELWAAERDRLMSTLTASDADRPK